MLQLATPTRAQILAALPVPDSEATNIDPRQMESPVAATPETAAASAIAPVPALAVAMEPGAPSALPPRLAATPLDMAPSDLAPPATGLAQMLQQLQQHQQQGHNIGGGGIDGGVVGGGNDGDGGGADGDIDGGGVDDGGVDGGNDGGGQQQVQPYYNNIDYGVEDPLAQDNNHRRPMGAEAQPYLYQDFGVGALNFGVGDLPELVMDEHAMADLREAIGREEAHGTAHGELRPWQQIFPGI